MAKPKTLRYTKRADISSSQPGKESMILDDFTSICLHHFNECIFFPYLPSSFLTSFFPSVLTQMENFLCARHKGNEIGLSLVHFLVREDFMKKFFQLFYNICV